jgi:hypothetical protein
MESPPPPVPAGPPDDPEEWTDEEWLAWLEATDPGEETAPGSAPAHRPRLSGNVLGVAMLGLRDAIYGRPDEPVVIVQDAPGDPPDDELHDLHLDPDHPERSIVVRRRPTRRAPDD